MHVLMRARKRKMSFDVNSNEGLHQSAEIAQMDTVEGEMYTNFLNFKCFSSN